MLYSIVKAKGCLRLLKPGAVCKYISGRVPLEVNMRVIEARSRPSNGCGAAYSSSTAANLPLSEVRNTLTLCVKQDADELKFKTSLMNNSRNARE